MSLCMAYVFAAVVEYAVANFIKGVFRNTKKSNAVPNNFGLENFFYYKNFETNFS